MQSVNVRQPPKLFLAILEYCNESKSGLETRPFPLSTVVPIAGNLVEYLDTSVLLQMQFVLHVWREDCSRIGGSKNLGGCNSGCFTTRKRRAIQQIRKNTCTLRQTWSQSVLSCFLAFCMCEKGLASQSESSNQIL